MRNLEGARLNLILSDLRRALPARRAAILSWLFNVSFDKEQSEIHSSETRSTFRASELCTLERLRVNTPSRAEVERMVRRRVESGLPWGLYLRNFSASVSRREASIIERLAGAWQPDGWSMATMYQDKKAQSALAELADARDVPFVAVRNPLVDPAEDYALHELALGSRRWEVGVSSLLDYVHVVVLAYSEITPGVLDELQLLRARALENRTIVIDMCAAAARELSIMEEIDEVSQGTAIGLPPRRHWQSHLAGDGLFDGFPHRIAWDGSSNLLPGLDALLDVTLDTAMVRKSRRPLKLPPPDRPARWKLSTVANLADNTFRRVGEHEDIEAALNLCTIAATFAYLAHHSAIRAWVLLAMSRLEMMRGRIDVGEALMVAVRACLYVPDEFDGNAASLENTRVEFTRHLAAIGDLRAAEFLNAPWDNQELGEEDEEV